METLAIWLPTGLLWGFCVVCLLEGINPVMLICEKVADWTGEIWHGVEFASVSFLRRITGRQRPDYERIAELEQALFQDSNR